MPFFLEQATSSQFDKQESFSTEKDHKPYENELLVNQEEFSNWIEKKEGITSFFKSESFLSPLIILIKNDHYTK